MRAERWQYYWAGWGWEGCRDCGTEATWLLRWPKEWLIAMWLRKWENDFVERTHSVARPHCFINSSLLLWASAFWSILNSSHQETAMLPQCYAAQDNIQLLPLLLLLPEEGKQVECFCFRIIKIDMPSHLWFFFSDPTPAALPQNSQVG